MPKQVVPSADKLDQEDGKTFPRHFLKRSTREAMNKLFKVLTEAATGGVL